MFENVEVMYHPVPMNVTDAAEYCEARSGYLPVINSVKEANAVLSKREFCLFITYQKMMNLVNDKGINFRSTRGCSDETPEGCPSIHAVWTGVKRTEGKFFILTSGLSCYLTSISSIFDVRCMAKYVHKRRN